MPKIIEEEEEEVEEDEEDEEEMDEEDELEEEEYPKEPPKIKSKKVETRGRKPKKPEEPKRRFGIVPPQPLRYVDTETNEVIVEADINENKSMLVAILVAIADLKEQQERIEVQIGAITG